MRYNNLSYIYIVPITFNAGFETTGMVFSNIFKLHTKDLGRSIIVNKHKRTVYKLWLIYSQVQN